MKDSPCIGICTIDPESGLCIGCSRTLKEIGEWYTDDNDAKKQILIKVKKRDLKKMEHRD